MTVINTNVGALNARVAALSAQTNMEKAMQRLSSGMRINSAADDAAGLAVATKMESQLRGINMAIRNSNDGISLVQTAESGMSEISNMVIRMRELSVQMHNGIYSDGDRANAQLEVDALLAEIDKIANNTAFNGVKVLDGSYNSEIRAGNTNPEVIPIAIQRMNTDSLGGVAITDASEAAVDTSTTFVHSEAKSTMSAGEGQVQILKDRFSQGFKDFVNSNQSGTYAMVAGGDSALFTVNSSGTVSLVGGELDFDNATDANFDNVYEFSVSYTAGSETVTEHIKLNITDTAVKTAAANTATTNLTVSEAENVSFESAGANSVLSDAFKEFVAADTGTGSFAIGGTDAADFSLNTATGKVTVGTGNFDFENPADNGTNNVYDITIAYTNSANKVFTETIALTVTDNATGDAGSVSTTLDRPDLGRSSIQLNQNNSASVLDFTNANVHDMLSQGAKDFITRSGGTAATFAHLTETTDAGNHGAITQTATANTGTALTTAMSYSIADNASGTIVLTLTLENAAASANVTETFTETITIDITDNGASGTGTYSQGLGRTEQSGSQATMTGTSDGEPVVMEMTDRDLFTKLNEYTQAHQGGSYVLNGGATAGLSMTGSTLTLAAGSNAGTYTGTVVYTDLNNQTFTQDISLTTTDAPHPDTATVVQSSTNQTKDALTSASEITGGKSIIQVDETLRATIKSQGSGAVLSSQLGAFTGAHPKGVYSLSGADAASFEVDKAGDIKSKVIMNYEEKAQFNFNLVYTQGDNVYTEKVVLNVRNNTADDGNHIANVDISTQQGALDAISILDDALNTITASQAKLGSSQNRLQHNIDNLTALSSQTEISRGRITDADYAAETSQLSKQQILSQAATSMLAQANQSKQGVLALLQ